MVLFQEDGERVDREQYGWQPSTGSGGRWHSRAFVQGMQDGRELASTIQLCAMAAHAISGNVPMHCG